MKQTFTLLGVMPALGVMSGHRQNSMLQVDSSGVRLIDISLKTNEYINSLVLSAL